MIYDMLFSLNTKLEPKPQMVESYTKSADGLTWRSSSGTASSSSDGQPGPGQGRRRLDQALGQPHPGRRDDDPVHEGDRGHRPRHVRDPARQAVRAGAGGAGHARKTRCSSTARSEAQTPIRTQRSPTAIGSGPFVMVKEEWVPGSKVVYRKNPAYKAAVRRARRVRRGQARQGRSRRVAGDPRRQHRDPGPHQGRGRHHRDPAHRPPAAHAQGRATSRSR